MRVNSTSYSLPTKRLVMRSSIVILMLVVCFITTSFTNAGHRDLRAKHVNIVIRKIGHLLLLQAGDSTSRVLPVAEIEEGMFVLRFEKEFVFNHDSLIALSMNLLPETEFPSGYTVTVHDCKSDAIVYGFQVNNTLPDILTCRGRPEPTGCYSVEFAFPDFHEAAGIDPTTEERTSSDADVQSHVEREALKTTTSNKGSDPLAE